MKETIFKMSLSTATGEELEGAYRGVMKGIRAPWAPVYPSAHFNPVGQNVLPCSHCLQCRRFLRARECFARESAC